MPANEEIMFSRTAIKACDDLTELRVDIPTELAKRIDAVLMVNGIACRRDWVVPALTKLIDAEFHKAIVLLRTAHINPLVSDALGGAPE